MRNLWHTIYDLDARSLSVDFYLGDEPDGSIRRSPWLGFRLA